MTAVSDTVAFTLEESWEEDPENGDMQICKITFSDTGTTRQIIHSMDYWDYVSKPHEYDWCSLNYFLGYAEYGTTRSIICITAYEASFVVGMDWNKFYFRTVVINIDTLNIVETWTPPADYANASLDNTNYSTSKPVIWNNKLMMTISIDTIFAFPPGPPYGSHCIMPTICIDIVTGIVTMIDNIVWNFDTSEAVIYVDCVGTIDFINNRYYWYAYDDDDAGSSWYYISSDMTMHKGGTCADWIEINQAPDHGVGFYPVGGTSYTSDVKEVGTNNYITTIDIENHLNDDEGNAEVDQITGTLYSLKSDRLQGKVVYGSGSNRDILIDWGTDPPPNIIPFLYPANRNTRFQMFNNRAIITVESQTSGSPYSYQQNFYLLKET
jgi:hypothetical protein